MLLSSNLMSNTKMIAIKKATYLPMPIEINTTKLMDKEPILMILTLIKTQPIIIETK